MDDLLERRFRTDIMWGRANSRASLEARHPGGHPWTEATIIAARYGGIYEGAAWMAWIGDVAWLDDHQSGDNECLAFWSHYGGAPIGRGSDPNAALADLIRVCCAGREAFVVWDPDAAHAAQW